MPSHSPATAPSGIPVVAQLNALVRRVAETAAWLNLVLIGVIIAQVILRYGFHHGLVPLEELMWHLSSVAFMFGLAYGVSRDTHIRMDLIHAALGARTKALLEILGILLLLMPFISIVFLHSLDWVADAYRMGESSSSPQGLPHRWVIKAVIPLSFLLLFLAALARLIAQFAILFSAAPREPAR